MMPKGGSATTEEQRTAFVDKNGGRQISVHNENGDVKK